MLLAIEENILLLLLTLPNLGFAAEFPIPNTTAFLLAKSNHLQHSKEGLPQWNDYKPVDVSVGFYIASISNFRAEEMSYEVDLYMKACWQDTRFYHPYSVPVLITDKADIAKFWIPDFYFSNAQESFIQEVVVPNFSMRIYKQGDIKFSARINLKLSCQLNLHSYPLDSQECDINLLSYNNDDKHLVIRWFDYKAVVVNSEINLPEMRILDVSHERFNKSYTYGEQNDTDAENSPQYSCVRARIYLKRDLGYHLLQTYLPTGLIVLISWFSFYIDPSAIPARITLSFTTLLTLHTAAAGTRSALPPVSYAKAIACTMFLFCVLLEFAYVNNLLRKSKKKQEIAETVELMTDTELKEEAQAAHIPQSGRPSIFLRTTMDGKRLEKVKLHNKLQEEHYVLIHRALFMDRISGIAFPAAFTIFNIAYWSYYLS